MGKKKSKTKVYTVNVPQASPNVQENQPSTAVADLRNQFSQDYSLLQQQAEAGRLAYEQQIANLQNQYNQQVSLLQGQLGVQGEQVGLLQNQLTSQSQQYSLLQQKLQQQQDEAKKQYEEQQKYYADLLKQQQDQAAREQDAARRALGEAEQAQSGLQVSMLQNLDTQLQRRGTTAAKSLPTTAVTRGSTGSSLLRR